ncbi:SGNH/GDSL hydrolase family protein [Pseudomonas sp. gcc21]|uniref:SGNH/GDSL hydrolase family protein n=1 Tax=Pseudomonas sp. gcc21 TaxID=2726989 RepID=UPI00145285F8|nr:SGNH/GDSL hydrolase family protein [Pseudomonas sp. gcc21]QJD57972.1 SGNH/GDSL hydrolase family protein [Pseudomonas sp. gcc21]
MSLMIRIKHCAFIAAALTLMNIGTANAVNPPVSGTADTMIIGDSVFALSGDIKEYLEDDLGEPITSHARSGCQMIGGNLICSRRYAIPEQYDNASKRGIKTVIMNGGGNDIQLNDCSPSLEKCMPLLQDLEDEIASLAQQMQADGIEEIIFLGYYNAKGSAAAMREINEYSMNYKARTYPGLGITFVDVRDRFNGNEDRYIANDEIHPTAEGSRVLADLLLEKLTD